MSVATVFFVFLVSLGTSQVPPSSKGEFINSGTPNSITLSFDCTVRQYAYEYGKQMQPTHGTFVHLFDALQLQACNQTRPKVTTRKISYYPKHYLNDLSDNPCIYYIDPINGNDSNNGKTPDNAFLTIEKGINATRNSRINNTQLCTLNLLEGIFYQKEQILLTPKDSYLTIQNYNGSNVILSGAVPLIFDSNNDWKLEEFKYYEWYKYNNANNVWGRVSAGSSNDYIDYIGSFNSYDNCQQQIYNLINSGSTYHSFTYHENNTANGDYATQCFGIKDISWGAVEQEYISSGKYEGRNIWSRKVENFNDFNNVINGLRINNKRSIRARFPDQITETQMQYYALSGWISYTTKWKPPNTYPTPQDIIINSTNYPSVEWPMNPPGGQDAAQFSGMGAWGDFFVGVGGPCSDLTPNFGYWCTPNSPRGNYLHQSPSGVYLSPNIGLSLPYTSGASDAVIHAWRPAHWFSWMWNVSSYDPNSTLCEFDYGGVQGGEGETKGAEWFISNVFEELSMPNEYFYNRTTHTLYYYYNSSSKTPPPDDTLFVATRNKVIFNISGSVRLQDGPPVRNITIQGLTIRDTELTYLDSHGLPSGGDWAICKKGGIYIQGSENVKINDLFMTRLDSNGIFIYGYNRNVTITNNTFEWLGESAIASWGYTEGLEDILPGGGPDGTMGNQPRFNIIKNNLAREIGIFEKQTSMYFQAQTAQTLFENNIFFNGPRAGININDGFLGDNYITNNLIINTCRESGDHGNINTWDRIPYIITKNNGSKSIIPSFNHINNNFFIGTYDVTITTDNDDGSCYYKTYNNFFVYSSGSLKSDFAGHDNRHYNNLYGYTNGAVFLLYHAGYNDEFTQNSGIFTSNSDYTSNCNLPSEASNMVINNNTIYIPDPSTFTVCNVDFKTWQSEGNDPGTTINSLPSDNQIIQMAKDLLGH